MPTRTTTTTTANGNGRTPVKWWTSLINMQTLMLIGAAFVSVVTFWNNVKNHSQHLKTHDAQIEGKADRADVKSIEDRVTRQYETNNKILDRIIILEKQQEYQRGVQDGKKEKVDDREP